MPLCQNTHIQHYWPFLSLSLTHTHPHSGLYQNPVSRVCEPCDTQCLRGCTGGTVRLLTDHSPSPSPSPHNHHHTLTIVTPSHHHTLTTTTCLPSSHPHHHHTLTIITPSPSPHPYHCNELDNVLSSIICLVSHPWFFVSLALIWCWPWFCTWL